MRALPETTLERSNFSLNASVHVELALVFHQSVAETCKAAHSRSDYDRVVAPPACTWQVRDAIAFAPSFDQFSGDIARDIQCFGNRAPLRNQARKFV